MLLFLSCDDPVRPGSISQTSHRAFFFLKRAAFPAQQSNHLHREVALSVLLFACFHLPLEPPVNTCLPERTEPETFLHTEF